MGILCHWWTKCPYLWGMKQQFFWVAMLGLLFTLCVGCDTTDPQGANQRAVVSDSSAYTPEATIERLNREIESNPSNWALFQERSEAFFALGNTAYAISDIREAIKLNDQSPDLHYLRGFYALADEDTALARSEFQLAALYGATNPDVYYQQGQMQFLRGEYDRAMVNYTEAARLDTLDPIYPFAMGFLAQTRKQFRKSLAFYKEALTLQPRHTKTLLQLHDLYVTGFNNVEEAMAYNEQVLDKTPQHPLANYNKGSFFYNRAVSQKQKRDSAFQQSFNQAVEFYTLAIAASDSFALPHVYRGMCYVEGERYDLALSDFEQAVAKDSMQALAHYQLAGLYEFYEEPEKAAFHRRKAGEQ